MQMTSTKKRALEFYLRKTLSFLRDKNHRNSCIYISPHYCERYRFIKVFKDSGKIVRAFAVSRAIEEKRGEKTHLDII